MFKIVNGEGTNPRLTGILAAVAIILFIVVIWIGNCAIVQLTKTPPRPALTADEKQQIFESLRLPPGTPPLTADEKLKIMRSPR